MLHTRSLLLTASLALLAGCGARTDADDYRLDGGVPSPDVSPDVRPDVLPDVRPDITPLCPPGTVLCGGVCTNIQSDVSNCGRCGMSCGTSSSVSCQNGVCVGVACPAGWTPCSGVCVNLTSDPSNCGVCGRGCMPGSDCFFGNCRVGPICPTGQTLCGSDCVDITSNPFHCGACGNACPDGQTCRFGACVGFECPPGLFACGDLCVDLRTDQNNCGGCGLVCPPGGICSDGRCEAPMCPAPTTRCGTSCANLASDPTNCGACGRACAAGQRCSSGVCAAMTMSGTPFQIASLTSLSCRTIEHNMATGDDRGGIAIGSNRVFYTGDTATVAFDLDSLAVAGVGSQRFDGIFGVASPGLAFTLGSNRVALDERTSIVDTLLGVGPSAMLSAALLPLSTPIFLNRDMTFGDVGIFGGLDRVIITSGARAWIIDGTMPVVTELAITPVGEHQNCESWAYWGVAEFFEGAPWVAYVRNSTTISRRNLLTGETRTVASFTNLSDMCSFTVSPTRSRWYFHHEGASQFRTGDETLGFCDARFRM